MQFNNMNLQWKWRLVNVTKRNQRKHKITTNIKRIESNLKTDCNILYKTSPTLITEMDTSLNIW